MTYEFTAVELKEVIRSARAINPGLDEKQVQSLVELQVRLADSGYLEAVDGLIKLEKETGAHFSQAMERHCQLLKESEKLEKKIATQHHELEILQFRVKEMEEKLRAVLKDAEQATEQLRGVKQELEREEMQLEDYRQHATIERHHLDEDVATCRRKVQIAEKEIVTASQIKREVAKHGFSLELAMGLAHEFAGYGDAKERLAEVLKKDGKLTNYLVTLEGKTKTLEENHLQMEEILSQQAAERDQHKAILSRLKGEIAEKNDIVSFYHRFVHMRKLMEYAGTSNLTFHHCVWCGALFWILKPGGMPVSVYKCPWCGLTLVEADKSAYATVSQPPGAPLKLLA